MRQSAAAQHIRRQDHQTQRVNAEYQSIHANTIGIENKVMERVLLQNDSVVDRENLRDHLYSRCGKGNRSKCTTQKEQGNSCSKGERDHRLTHLQEGAEQ